jgi:hypothetical protein
MIVNKANSRQAPVGDLFPQLRKAEQRRSLPRRQRSLKRLLGEVILGQRSFLKVHSDVLQTDFWFVNEALADPSDRLFNGKTITMAMLAEIMMSRQPALRTVEQLFRDNI